MDNLTWPQAQELLVYWKANPPTHILVKGMVGMKNDPAPSTPDDGWTDEKMDELMGLFGGAGGQVVQVKEG